MSEPYTRDMLRLAASLEPFRPIRGATGHSSLRSPTCGSEILCELRVVDGRIEAAAFNVSACAYGQAAAAVALAAASGREVADVARWPASVERWLSEADAPRPPVDGIAALEPARQRRGRHGAVLLPFRAMAAALDGERG